MRSPRTAPRVNGLDGSTESTPTVRSASRRSFVIEPISVDLPTPGGPVMPITRAAGRGEELGDQRVARGVAVLDQADRARQGAPVARERRLPRDSSLVACSVIAAEATVADRASRYRHKYQPRLVPRLNPLVNFRFARRNGMLNRRYAVLLWRYLWRRFFTRAGWRWETDGPVFFGKGLELQISKTRQGQVRPLRLDRRRHEDPLPRGRGRDREEDGDRPGGDDLRLPARRDRRAVRDRRPGDVHRLRPRHRRGGAARSASRGSTSATS